MMDCEAEGGVEGVRNVDDGVEAAEDGVAGVVDGMLAFASAVCGDACVCCCGEARSVSV